jgi:DNA-binding NtrC family response regulator
MARYAKKAGKKITTIDRLTLEMLQNYHWPGNVRELQNVIERAVILCETPVLSVDETSFRREAPSRGGQPIFFNAALNTSEREIIERGHDFTVSSWLLRTRCKKRMKTWSPKGAIWSVRVS